MDNATLAAFRASGETDLQKFLQKQAVTADTPPGVPGGYAAGNAAFQGSTNAERGAVTPAPTGAAFLDRIRNGFSALSGVPNQIRTALTGSAAPAPVVGNLFAASRTGALESELDALQRRSTINYGPAARANTKAVIAGRPSGDLADRFATENAAAPAAAVIVNPASAPVSPAEAARRTLLEKSLQSVTPLASNPIAVGEAAQERERRRREANGGKSY